MTTIELGFISITGIWGISFIIGLHLGKAKTKYYKQQMEIKEYEVKIQKAKTNKLIEDNNKLENNIIDLQNKITDLQNEKIIFEEEIEKLEYYKDMDETILKKQLEREERLTNNLNAIASYTGDESSDSDDK